MPRCLPPHSKNNLRARPQLAHRGDGAPQRFDYSLVTSHCLLRTTRGHSLMVKFQPSKLAMRVRFPLPAVP